MIGAFSPAANFCKHPGVGVACSMAGDDPFRRYQEVGAEFVEAARARADEFLRQLAQMGDSTQRQAQDAVDDLVEGGRKGTGQILTSIRRGDHGPAVAARSGHQGRSGRPGGPACRRRGAGPGRQVERAAPRRRCRHPGRPPPAARPRRARRQLAPRHGPRRRRRRKPRPAGLRPTTRQPGVSRRAGGPGEEGAGRGLSRRRRLDAELVRRRLAASRSQAAELIEARRVLVGGAVAERASRLVDPAEAVTLAGPPPRFVGRGGEKLDAALRHFGLDVGGRRALDAGASTGGFTDCLLQRGADIGRGRRRRPRSAPRTAAPRPACDLAGTDQRPRRPARPISAADQFDVVVADLSFISLRTVATTLAGWTHPAAISSCW